MTTSRCHRASTSCPSSEHAGQPHEGNEINEVTSGTWAPACRAPVRAHSSDCSVMGRCDEALKGGEAGWAPGGFAAWTAVDSGVSDEDAAEGLQHRAPAGPAQGRGVRGSTATTTANTGRSPPPTAPDLAEATVDLHGTSLRNNCASHTQVTSARTRASRSLLRFRRTTSQPPPCPAAELVAVERRVSTDGKTGSRDAQRQSQPTATPDTGTVVQGARAPTSSSARQPLAA